MDLRNAGVFCFGKMSIPGSVLQSIYGCSIIGPRIKEGANIMLNTKNVVIMATIVVYLGAMIGIGIWCSRRNKSTDDFYLGGRKLGPWSRP